MSKTTIYHPCYIAVDHILFLGVRSPPVPNSYQIAEIFGQLLTAASCFLLECQKRHTPALPPRWLTPFLQMSIHAVITSAAS